MTMLSLITLMSTFCFNNFSSDADVKVCVKEMLTCVVNSSESYVGISKKINLKSIYKNCEDEYFE